MCQLVTLTAVGLRLRCRDITADVPVESETCIVSLKQYKFVKEKNCTSDSGENDNLSPGRYKMLLETLDLSQLALNCHKADSGKFHSEKTKAVSDDVHETLNPHPVLLLLITFIFTLSATHFFVTQ